MSTTDHPQLPEYVCTRRTQAAKIIEIGEPDAMDPLMWRLALELPSGEHVTQRVHAGYMQRHRPQAGGYFARNEDGYARYLPAAVFEADYAAVPNLQPVNLADIELLAGKVWKVPVSTPAMFLGEQWTDAELASLRSQRPEPMRFNVIRQAEIIQQAPPASEHLHAAPHYQDLLPAKGGK